VEGGKEIDKVKKKSENTNNDEGEEKKLEESKFTNQNWAKVLDEIWKRAPNRYGRGSRGYDDSHSLATKLKITGYELGLIALFLEEQNLIEYDQQQNNWIQITSKGFDVAMQNRNAEKNDRINKGSLFLALSIAIFAVVSLLLGIDNWLQRLVISVMISIAVVVGGFIIRRI
jgi:hypothetical protein